MTTIRRTNGADFELELKLFDNGRSTLNLWCNEALEIILSTPYASHAEALAAYNDAKKGPRFSAPRPKHQRMT